MLKRVLIISLLFLFLSPVAVFAKDDAPTLKVLPKGEVVNGDYFAAGEIVEISGSVNGDVYAAGGTVLVDGVINGDLLVAGGTVTVSGEVTEDIRAAGGQVNINGKVGRNVTVATGNAEFSSSSEVVGNITVFAGNVVLNSTVGGNINAFTGNLRLSSNAKVGGAINYTSEDEISLSETASVSGSISRGEVPEFLKEKNRKEMDSFMSGVDMFAKFSSMLTSLIIGLLLLKFFPNYTKRATDMLKTKFMPSLGIGFVALIAAPILIIILFVTLVGIPLALILGLVFFFYLYLARIYAMLAIGEKLSEWTKVKISPVWIFIVGLLAYYLLTFIPIIGGIIKLVVLVASLGASLKNEKATWAQASKAKVV